MTSSMQKSGAFLLRIGADGRYPLVARGAQYAELWARDARLEYVSITDPDADGRLGPRSTAMQRRWSGGDASATSMGLPPPGSFDQCGMMGGTMRDGTTCIGSGGDRLPVN